MQPYQRVSKSYFFGTLPRSMAWLWPSFESHVEADRVASRGIAPWIWPSCESCVGADNIASWGIAP